MRSAPKFALESRADFTVEQVAHQLALPRAIEIVEFKDVRTHHFSILVGGSIGIKRCLVEPDWR